MSGIRHNFRKIMNRFKEKFKNLDFGPKNDPFTPFRAK